MKLFLFMAPVGYHTAAWKHPESFVEQLYGIEVPKYLAQRAEEAKFHVVFLADWLTFENLGPTPDHTGYEPFTTIGALSQVTEKIGLVATASTTFLEPYHMARYLNQLDFLTKGRVGWNIVTSTTGQENFNAELPRRDERYVRAYEYLDVVTKLWDAWEDDAVVNDRARGVWAESSRIHRIDHEGDYYKVEGPLIVPRSPQGWPVLVQAGASDAGKSFAAQYAEAVFTAKGEFEHAKEYYDDLKSRTALAGRDPEKLAVLPGLLPIVGSTRKEAQEIADELADYIDIDFGLAQLADSFTEIDFTQIDLDDTLPADKILEPSVVFANEGANRYERLYHRAVVEKYTVRRLIREVTLARGHGLIVGTAEDVADHMQHWFESNVCDGFVIQPASVPVGIDRFFDEVVPILQERGLFRTEYEGDTLRENLGLDRPSS